jgi:hypothetical protein
VEWQDAASAFLFILWSISWSLFQFHQSICNAKSDCLFSYRCDTSLISWALSNLALLMWTTCWWWNFAELPSLFNREEGHGLQLWPSGISISLRTCVRCMFWFGSVGYPWMDQRTKKIGPSWFGVLSLMWLSVAFQLVLYRHAGDVAHI